MLRKSVLFSLALLLALAGASHALTVAESITRFQANEVRINTFTNDEGHYTTTGGGQVETLPSLVIRKDSEISQRYNVEAKGAWLTATEYVVNDVVTDTGVVYLCVVAHTSGTFTTDLAAGKWIPYQMALPFGQYCDSETAVIATNNDAAMAQIVVTNDYQLKADLAIAAGKIYSAIPGAIISTKYSIRSATYRWILTGSGTAEYRCELAAGTDPGFSQPTAVWINGAEAVEGTAGTLNSGEWDYSGGYVIVRTGADSDPDSEAAGYVEVHYTLDLSSAHLEDNGGQMFDASPGDVTGLVSPYADWFATNTTPGTTDMTNGILCALASVTTFQDILLRPGTVYKTTAPVTLLGNGKGIVGVGGVAQILSTSATDIIRIEGAESAGTSWNWHLENLEIKASAAGSTLTLLRVGGGDTWHGVARRCWFESSSAATEQLVALTNTDAGSYRDYFALFERCVFRNGKRGLVISGDWASGSLVAATQAVNRVKVTDSDFYGYTEYGIYMTPTVASNTNGHTIKGVHFDSASSATADIYWSGNHNYVEGMFESAAEHLVHFDDASDGGTLFAGCISSGGLSYSVSAFKLGAAVIPSTYTNIDTLMVSMNIVIDTELGRMGIVPRQQTAWIYPIPGQDTWLMSENGRPIIFGDYNDATNARTERARMDLDTGRWVVPGGVLATGARVASNTFAGEATGGSVNVTLVNTFSTNSQSAAYRLYVSVTDAPADNRMEVYDIFIYGTTGIYVSTPVTYTEGTVSTGATTITRPAATTLNIAWTGYGSVTGALLRIY